MRSIRRLRRVCPVAAGMQGSGLCLSMRSMHRKPTNGDFGLSNVEMDISDVNIDLGEHRLSLNDVESYSSEDVSMRAAQLTALYNPAVYAFCFYPSVDIVHLMLDLSLLPSSKPELQIAHWMADPKLVLRQPRVLRELMGTERWGRMEEPLTDLTKALEEFSPLVRALKKYRLPLPMWLPFCRQFAVESLITRERAFLPAMLLAMCSGRLPPSWALPTDESHRIVVVSEVMMSLAVETGALQVATTSAQITRLNQIQNTYQMQKLLMNAFSANGRRELDWDARSNGTLSGAITDWRKNYFKLVESDLEAAASGLTELNDSDLQIDEFDFEDEDGLTSQEDKEASRVGMDDDDQEELDRICSPDAVADDDSAKEVDSSPDDYEDEEVFEDPSAKASVSNYFTSGSVLSRAKTVSGSGLSKQQAKRDEKMKKMLLQRISSQISKKKDSVKQNVRMTNKALAKQNKKSNSVG